MYAVPTAHVTLCRLFRYGETEEVDYLDLVLHPFALRLFCFYAPCQFTPLLNLPSLIFGLSRFGWLRSGEANPLFLIVMFSIYAYFFWEHN